MVVLWCVSLWACSCAGVFFLAQVEHVGTTAEPRDVFGLRLTVPFDVSQCWYSMPRPVSLSLSLSLSVCLPVSMYVACSVIVLIVSHYVY